MIKNIFARLMLALLLISPAFALVPVAANAATTTHKTASINASSLIVASGEKGRLSGTSNASVLRVTISETSTRDRLYKSGVVSVYKGAWHVTINKKFADGSYTASVYQDVRGKLTLLTQGTYQVGTPAVATPITPPVKPTDVIPVVPAPTVPSTTVSTGFGSIKVMPIALLGGGTTHAGATVPISYLQVDNQSDASTTIAGFWIQEDGTAPESAIVGFSSVDDKGNNRMSVGGTEGQTPFVNGKAYVPSGAVIAPHGMKLFTIKAQLSTSAAAGKSLILNVAGVDSQVTSSSSFPVRGTTWVIQ